MECIQGCPSPLYKLERLLIGIHFSLELYCSQLIYNQKSRSMWENKIWFQIFICMTSMIRSLTEHHQCSIQEGTRLLLTGYCSLNTIKYKAVIVHWRLCQCIGHIILQILTHHSGFTILYYILAVLKKQFMCTALNTL